MTNLIKNFNRNDLILEICHKIQQEIVKHAFDYFKNSDRIYVYDDMAEVIYSGSFITTKQQDDSVGYKGELRFHLEKIEILDVAYSRKGIELKNLTNILKTIFK